MRRYFLLFIFLQIIAYANCKVKINDVENIAFTEVSHNFGTISNSDGVISTNFTCVNQSSSALVILAIRTSCSCLKGKFSRKPIPPGSKTSIALFLDAAKMEEGVFHRVVQVKTNRGVYHLTIQGVKRK